MSDSASNEEIRPSPQENDEKTPRNKQMNVPSVISNLLTNLPPLPSCELTDPHDDVTLPRLIEALQNRHRIRQMMIDEYSKAADMMKSTLQELDNKLISKDDFIEEQNVKLEEKDKIIQSNKAEIEQLEKWTKMQEHKIGILQKTTKIYEDHKRSMKQELETREQRLQKEVSDKKRMEQRMQRMVTATQLKWEKECERRVNVMELEMQKKLQVKDDKLKQVKAILMESSIQPHQMQPEQQSSEEALLSSAFPLPLSSSVDAPRLQGPDSPTRVNETESNPMLVYPVPSASSSFSVSSGISAWERLTFQDSTQCYHSLTTSTRAQYSAGSTAQCWSTKKDESNSPTCDLAALEKCHKTLTPVRPLHHRSCSASGEKWMDHKPSSSMDLGTVLQPVIPKAIRVSAPSERALSKCDRYMLTHQEVASDGEVQTKLIKGEVIKTRGGGQAVQFTDIETLKQELTTVPSDKRKSSKGRPANGYQTDEAWTDVETRCSVAMEMRAGSDMSPGNEHRWISKCRKP